MTTENVQAYIEYDQRLLSQMNLACVDDGGGRRSLGLWEDARRTENVRRMTNGVGESK